MSLLRRQHLQFAFAAVAMSFVGTATESCQREQPLRFSISVPKSRRSTTADGRLLVMLSKDPSREPRFQITNNTLTTQQVFGIDIDGWQPDTPAVVDIKADGFPVETLDRVPAGEYTIQALLNVYETFHRKDGHVVKLPMDQWEGQHWHIKPGNLYSEPRKVRVD